MFLVPGEPKGCLLFVSADARLVIASDGYRLCVALVSLYPYFKIEKVFSISKSSVFVCALSVICRLSWPDGVVSHMQT
jgi:hypothetical protein